ncbi:TetR/AcrR family transcriptional regulator [Cellulomonas sp. HZM]|uniref:TetR/AcrR family transcriptional regulator n=1 Tax=Cellulomonas sp. HZM TaxID=1454010 RepID=UPI000AFBB968|nr:TetR family transcriptional regulator [Cellulomonas sp. HZM]
MEDRTGAADRIRDAAITRFARDGFGASVRVIAADAQVSAALVIHHYGSKDALRAACDEHVHALVRDAKTDAMRNASPAAVIAQLATVEQYADVFAYMVRSLLEGGEGAVRFVDGLLADTEQYLAAGVEAGTVRPSLDPRGRARVLVATTVGSLLLTELDAVAGRGTAPTKDPARAIVEMSHAAALPGIELYTYGLFTGSEYLDAYLAREQQDDHEHGHEEDA